MASADGVLRNAVLGIGQRLLANAEWAGKTCTWRVYRADTAAWPAFDSKLERANGSVYAGTAGIALFLGELYAIWDDDAVAETAIGAVEFALEESLAPQCSFFAGQVGTAFAAVRVGERLSLSKYFDEAQRVLDPFVQDQLQDRGIDVIRGAAGAIPPLLAMRDFLPATHSTDLALRLGELLIAAAHMEPVGWSWGNSSGVARRLCGYAHGASGIAHALLELHRATGDRKFLYAMEQGFSYERQHFDRAEDNWPDFRHKVVGRFLSSGKLEELKTAHAAGQIPAFAPSFMTAWCHGSPGIGLVRLRAFETTGTPGYRAEAERAVASTLESIRDPDLNYSLCHGYFGNCELLLYAAEVFHAPHLREAVIARALSGCAEFDSATESWRCGSIGEKPDPSLLVGEAGIGYFLLRLIAPTCPSILFIRPRTLERAAPDRLISDWRVLQQAYVDEHWSRSLAVAACFCPSGAMASDPRFTLDATESDAQRARSSLTEVIASADEQVGGLLRDIFNLESAKFEAAVCFRDYATHYLDTLTRSVELDLTGGCVLRMNHNAKLLSCQWDWDAWLTVDRAQRPPRPSEGPIYHLLWREGSRVVESQLDLLTACILDQLETPMCFGDLVESVAGEYESSGEYESIVRSIEQAVRGWYKRGAIDCIPS